MELATSGVLLNQATIRIAFTQAGQKFVWIVTVMSLFGIGMSTINLFRPFWTRGRLAVRVGQDVVSTLVFGLMARAGALIYLSGTSIPAAKSVEINATVNTWVSLFVAITAAICAVITIVDLVKLVFMKTNRPAWMNQVSGATNRLSC